MPTVHRKPFGRAHGQSATVLRTLETGTGVRAGILTYGGDLHSLTVPDTAGRPGRHLPDPPDRPGHPGTLPRPGEVLRSRTERRFPHLVEQARVRAAGPAGPATSDTAPPRRSSPAPRSSPRGPGRTRAGCPSRGPGP